MNYGQDYMDRLREYMVAEIMRWSVLSLDGVCIRDMDWGMHRVLCDDLGIIKMVLILSSYAQQPSFLGSSHAVG
jgi:hypothetical protein